MKKKSVFFLLLIFLVILSLVLIIIWDKANKKNKLEELKKQELEEIKTYELKNKEKSTILIYMTKTDKVVEMNLNEYLKGVLPAEMPPTYELEALKAQAVVARTYALEKRSSSSHEKGEICDNYAHCQAYLTEEQIIKAWKNRGYTETQINEYFKKIEEAVYSTSGEVITYDYNYIKAYFHANSGGKTEDVSSIWGKQNIPYLKSVESKGEDTFSNYRSSNTYTISELITKLNNGTDINCTSRGIEKEGIKILSYTKGGRVNNIKIGENIYSAEKLRAILSLKSTNFTVDIKDKKITFNVTGYRSWSRNEPKWSKLYGGKWK